eukprot:768280-Hanusia_phi.AAC.7
MYREAEALSLEVIAVSPADDAANSNLKAARSSMRLSSEDDDGIEEYDDDDDDQSEGIEPSGAKKTDSHQFNMNHVKNEEVRDQEGEEDDDQGSYIITEEDEEEDDVFAGSSEKFSSVCNGSEKKGCETLHEGGLQRWSVSTQSWSEILGTMKEGGLAIINDALQTKFAGTLSIFSEYFAVTQEKVRGAYKQFRKSILRGEHFSLTLKEMKSLFDSAEMR